MILRGTCIAVTGGSGRLGHFICAHLAAQGSSVRHLRDHVPNGLAAQDFSAFLHGCHGLVHAAFSHIPGKYRGGEGADPAAFWALNHDGTQRLVRQAKALGLAKIVLFSSRAVYGAHQVLPDGPLDERHPPAPDTLYGQLKHEAELLAARESGPTCAITALRATGVYGGGPAINKWTPLIQAALEGRLPTANPTKTEVSGETVAEAVGLALSAPNDAFAGQTFNLSEVKVTPQDLLTHGGFEALDIGAMPAATPLTGVELSARRIEKLGLKLRSHTDVWRSVKALRKALELGARAGRCASLNAPP